MKVKYFQDTDTLYIDFNPPADAADRPQSSRHKGPLQHELNIFRFADASYLKELLDGIARHLLSETHQVRRHAQQAATTLGPTMRAKLRDKLVAWQAKTKPGSAMAKRIEAQLRALPR